MAHPYSQSNTASQTDDGSAVINYQPLTSAFAIDNGPAVFAFLEKHPDLIPVILVAGQTLRAFFPHELYNLSVQHDPEYPTEWHVIVSVSTVREVDDAMQRLDAFDNVWLPTLSDAAHDLLLVTLAFL
jgi:hypothetical protein